MAQTPRPPKPQEPRSEPWLRPFAEPISPPNVSMPQPPVRQRRRRWGLLGRAVGFLSAGIVSFGALGLGAFMLLCMPIIFFIGEEQGMQRQDKRLVVGEAELADIDALRSTLEESRAIRGCLAALQVMHPNQGPGLPVTVRVGPYDSLRLYMRSTVPDETEMCLDRAAERVSPPSFKREVQLETVLPFPADVSEESNHKLVEARFMQDPAAQTCVSSYLLLHPDLAVQEAEVLVQLTPKGLHSVTLSPEALANTPLETCLLETLRAVAVPSLSRDLILKDQGKLGQLFGGQP